MTTTAQPPARKTESAPALPAIAHPGEGHVSLFSSESAFVSGQRMAIALCKSNLVPESYRGDAGLPNALIALDMAQRLSANPLMVMQNLYVVHGRPAWSSQFLIACVNACGRFSPMRYEFEGSGDDWGCRAVANDRAGNVLKGTRITIAMAKAEGWMSKAGSKWKTMPEQMLTYRAATFWARAYAPELTMGIPTSEEVFDIEGADTNPGSPVASAPKRATRGRESSPLDLGGTAAPAETPPDDAPPPFGDEGKEGA